MVNLFNYLLIFNIFGGAFILPINLQFQFCLGYIFIILFLLLYILRYRKIDINRTFLVILITLTITSLLNAFLGKTTISFIAKQVLGILITGIAYYELVKINNYDINNLFRIYFRFAFIVAAIGILQEFSFLSGFKRGYDYGYIIFKWAFARAECGMLRINSIFMEPAHFAITMAPACFVSLLNILRKPPFFYLNTKWTDLISSIIIMSYILTFSTIAYVVIFLSLVLIIARIRKSKYLLLALMILLMLTYAVYSYVPEVRKRTDAAIGFVNGSIKSAHQNLSVYALASNALVAYKSFQDSPLFGRGLGSHPVSYDEFMRQEGSNAFWLKIDGIINKPDAASLFLRLLSETGLFGVITVLCFVFGFRLKISDHDNLPVISNAMFILFIAQLLRQGHYFYNGLFFFVWMYYFAYKIYNKPNLKISE